MELITVTVPLDFNLFLISDAHVGAVTHDDDAWETMVEMVHSPYGDLKPNRNYVVDHGDAIEGITIDDPRFSFESTLEARIFNQMSMAKKDRLSIKKKIICWLAGNHEFSRSVRKMGDATKEMCDSIGVKYGTYSAIITYKTVKDKTLFKHFATHGYKSMNMQAGSEEQRIANMKTKLKRNLRNKTASCLLNSMGHTHKLLTLAPIPRLHILDKGGKLEQVYQSAPLEYVDGEIIHEDRRWYANTGCFLKTLGIGFSTYSERAGYDPTEIGFCVARVRHGKLVGIDEVPI